MPIDIELELSVIPSVNYNQVEGNYESLEVISNKGTELEDVQVLSNQILNQLLQACQETTTSQYEQDNLENNQEDTNLAELKSVDTLLANVVANQQFTPPAAIQQLTPPIEKKQRGCLLDLINDSFALSINSISTIFFLGKLANYSWE
ncbi:hypothetical protein LC593_14145 [Nostoc sp. CHAB 5844]|nr:hypothetical protein [Nostoc sp. CHAB 5844]